MSTRDQEIAKTILAQLGGNRFIAMTGANRFVTVENGLLFRLPPKGTKKNANGVRIRLDASDHYIMEVFEQHSAPSFRVEFSDPVHHIGVEHLREQFTEMTGLLTSL